MLFLLIWPKHLRTLFLLTLIPGIAVVALVALALQEPPHAEFAAKKDELPANSPTLSSYFRWYLVALVLFTLGNSSDAFLLVRSRNSACPRACYRSCGACFTW